MVDLNKSDGKRLGIGTSLKGEGTIDSEYTNGIKGHYVTLDGKLRGIPDRMNTVNPL